MTSAVSVASQRHGEDDVVEVKQSATVSTIHNIYRADDENLIIRDPVNRRSFVNRSAYVKLHRSLSAGTKRHSVDNLKGRFESLVKQNSEPLPPKEVEEDKKKPEEEKKSEEEVEFTPASFGYPKTAKLKPPILKPKPAVRRRPPKDVNSNVVKRTSESGDEISIVLQSASEESVDKIAKELSNFTMDGKAKKRGNSFKKLFMGGLFSKDKKKKEEEKTRAKYSDNSYNDNVRNESSSNRQPLQPSVQKYEEPKNVQEKHEEKIKELEQKYAELHVNRFNQIRRSFTEDKSQDYLPMDSAKKKPSISDYISVPVSKYIDTSSSASTESERPNGVVARDTPPRAQETYQNFKLVKPRASIPISSERSLPNPYQNETSPRTIERNLNKANGKDYPDKANIPPAQEDTYGTVFDSLEYSTSRNGEIKPINSKLPPPTSPKSPGLESTKLKLPPNREIYDLQPRVRSPIPTNKVSTEKIIATELLKNTRSPTPPKRSSSKTPEEVVANKPPISPKALPKTGQGDKIVTNAMVHAPRRAQTPLENRIYTNVPNYRSSTPVDLRMAAALKHSPQKEDIRRSVEEYYWKELKKLKEEEDSKLISLNGYYEDFARVRRSRSLSPSSHKGSRRSLSLPRDGRGQQNYVEYARVPPQQSIPEEQTLVIDGPVNRRLVYDQNFVRNVPERRSVDSIQRPIFRRGSLTKQEVYESQNYNKRVSFNNSQQAWPTRNGYVPNPPQRRLDSELEDEVFVQSPLQEPVYPTRYAVQNEPLYSNRVLEQFRAQQMYDSRRPVYQMGPRRLSMDSIPRSRQDIYVSRSQVVRQPTPNPAPGAFQVYNPTYSSRQSMTDANYGQKQVTVRNKFCDMYGQIHDAAPQSGVVMGRLQEAPPPRQQSYTDGFVRGSRLTASANDLGRRYGYGYGYGYDAANDKIATKYENRPLPPPPPVRRSSRPPQISDTESGSDASEIQRIMQNKSKNKKRGFFGK